MREHVGSYSWDGIWRKHLNIYQSNLLWDFFFNSRNHVIFSMNPLFMKIKRNILSQIIVPDTVTKKKHDKVDPFLIKPNQHLMRKLTRSLLIASQWEKYEMQFGRIFNLHCCRVLCSQSMWVSKAKPHTLSWLKMICIIHPVTHIRHRHLSWSLLIPGGGLYMRWQKGPGNQENPSKIYFTK